MPKRDIFNINDNHSFTTYIMERLKYTTSFTVIKGPFLRMK